jgi:3-phenylpropionate/trans-cinnamate dioxygenase ferredoxin reductase component
MTAPAVVVVGAGQAGCQLVSSLREGGFAGDVTLIGAERHLPYQRPPLSKGHLTGKAAREALWLRPDSWYAEHAIEVRLDATVVGLNRADQIVELADGSAVGYDVLVLGLGSRHRTLPLDGTELTGVVSLRTLDEADDIRARLELANDVVIIGGGFIGMEVASTAAALGKCATVIEVADQLMGRVLSTTTAAFLVHAHRARGLAVELGASARRIGGVDGRVASVELSDGRELAADLVLIGVGAVPNVELATSAGLDADNGIVVDSSLRTSDPAIFAIGDCVSAPNSYASGPRVRLESVQNAVSQARAVATTLLGEPGTSSAVPWFWSDQADLKLQIAGLTTGHDTVVVKGSLEGERFSAYCFAGEKLIGVESVNRPAEHMAARRLLAGTTAISPELVRAEDFDPKTALARVTA